MGRWVGGVYGNTLGTSTTVDQTTGVFSSSDQYYMKREGGWNLLDGSTSSLAAPSAKAIYDLGPDYQGASANGYYWLDPGGTGNYKQQYYCRMDQGGAWVAVAFIMREEFGSDNQYALSTANNRGTYPASTPYTVPASQTKIHNDAISAFEKTYNSSEYWYWFDHWSYTGSYPDSAQSNTNWPAHNSVVATGHDGSAPSAASGYANESDLFKHTRSLAAAFAGGGNTSTMLFGNGVSNHTNVAQYNWNNQVKRFSNVNKSDRNMDASQSQIYDFVDAAYTSAATAYSTLCDDEATGPYQMARDYNCYHQYLIIYVR